MTISLLGFVKQACNKSAATDQPAWHPSLPNSCENGLLISEKLYLMVSINLFLSLVYGWLRGFFS